MYHARSRLIAATVAVCWGLSACGPDGAPTADGTTTVAVGATGPTTTAQAPSTTPTKPAPTAGQPSVAAGAPEVSDTSFTRNTADDAFCESSNPGSFGVVLTVSYVDAEGDAAALWVDFGSGFVDHTADSRFGGDGSDGTAAFTICGFAGDPIGIYVADSAGNRSVEVHSTIPDD